MRWETDRESTHTHTCEPHDAAQQAPSQGGLSHDASPQRGGGVLGAPIGVEGGGGAGEGEDDGPQLLEHPGHIEHRHRPGHTVHRARDEHQDGDERDAPDADEGDGSCAHTHIYL